MPGLVIDYISPLLPHINDKTLYILDQDITNQKYMGRIKIGGLYEDQSTSVQSQKLQIQFRRELPAQSGVRAM